MGHMMDPARKVFEKLPIAKQKLAMKKALNADEVLMEAFDAYTALGVVAKWRGLCHAVQVRPIDNFAEATAQLLAWRNKRVGDLVELCK